MFRMRADAFRKASFFMTASEKLIDYLCLEIKNQPAKYATSMGMNSMDDLVGKNKE